MLLKEVTYAGSRLHIYIYIYIIPRIAVFFLWNGFGTERNPIKQKLFWDGRTLSNLGAFVEILICIYIIYLHMFTRRVIIP